MFIEQGIKPENKFWKYLVGSFIMILASSIGQIPLGVAIFFKAMSDGKPMPATQEGMLGYLELNLTLFLILFSFVIALIAIYIVVRNIHKQQFKDIVTSRPKLDKSRIFFSFSLWFVLSVITMLVDYFLDPESYVFQFNVVKFVPLFIIAMLMVPIQTSVEELVFRGYLMQGFGNLAKNKWFPLVMTSVIFGGMHFANPEVTRMGYLIMVYYIGTGFFLGILTLMDEGMELSLGFHAANNLVGVLLVTADWTAFQTYSVFKDVSEPSAGVDIIVPVLIIFPILLIIFSKVYKWTDWKGKLTGSIEIPVDEQQQTTNKIGQIND
ncbi:CPBP family intramembrane glutamic endopeptidase [Flavobacterium sp. DG1-102-2]|uniref:CPBP family intramembrane glutamic endopeptidase n=1 Tax=Flavobacterium sp. DG1-102-2 TaxID=3081663 RepID=UPI00294A44F6|nr:CPBP family intramembrane glutamic endopeptidase [Flavobacterium sp. DG1-102-2]MDV6168544.1 CPBP family intramembrane glutamic endopeptidase [Flavobacterium sp. DG1-102-2]